MKPSRALLAIVVATLMVACFPVFSFAAEDGGHVHGTAWRNAKKLPTKAGNYYLTTDVTITKKWNVKGTVTLCLNGHSIHLKNGKKGSVITIGKKDTLNLYDCVGTGSITGGHGRKNYLRVGEGGGVDVGDGGIFNMYGGVITDNETKDSGGGVFVHDATFNLYGGKIFGNTAAERGGGVYVEEEGFFRNYGGSVVGNTVNGREENVYVNGSIKVTGISISGPSSVKVGEKITLRASVTPADAAIRSVSWSSSNSSVATVSDSGVVKGVKGGSAKITCKANDGSGVSNSVTITVVAPSKVTGISISGPSSVKVGEKITLRASVTPADAAIRSVSWSSSNSSVATVSDSGVVKGVKGGSAKITCKANDGSGVSNSVTITVVAPSWGSWSAWQDTPVTASSTRQVETRKVYGYYYYKCPNCGNHMHVWNVGDPKWCGGCGYTGSLKGTEFVVFTTHYYNRHNPKANLSDWHGTSKWYYIDSTYGRLYAWIDSGNPSPDGKTQYRYRELK